MNPFDIVSSVSHNKKRIIDNENEHEYSSFIINRALSYYPDTLMYAQDMNINHHISGLLQYDYYFNSLRPKKRFSKWHKKEKTETLMAVMKYYGYSYRRAIETMNTLTKDQLDHIKNTMTTGIE